MKSTTVRPSAVSKQQSTTPWSISSSSGSAAEDKELLAIFESPYGKVERRAFEPKRAPARTALDETRYNIKNQKTGPEYLLVDGYNIIFAWDALKKLAAQDVAAAREALAGILANYRGWRRCEIILVFDAYKVKGNPGSMEKKNGIYIVYTKEAQTADSYIERATYDLGKNHRVRVATSDNMEQVIILGHGALRFVEFYMHSAVLSDLYAYRLVGLAIAKLCRALERSFFGRKGDPIEAAYFAGVGIERRFVAVGNVKDVVCEILFDDKPAALFFLAFDAA